MAETRDAADLFRSTAWYYARFRPDYPVAVIDALVQRFSLDAASWVIDLGCGTGQLAIPFAKRGVKVCAIDPSPEMLAEARAAEQRAGASGIDWRRGDDKSLRDFDPSSRSYSLCTMGASFHWMDRAEVLDSLDRLIAPRGGVALLRHELSAWTDESDWAKVTREVIVDFLGPERRAGAGTYANPTENHDVILGRSAFSKVETQEFFDDRTLTVDDIVGLQLSTSYASPAQLGGRLDAFRSSLKGRLLGLQPSGYFEWTMRTEMLVATR